MAEALRVLRVGGYFLCFTDWRQLPTITDAHEKERTKKMIGTSKDGSFRVHQRADGRIPVALGIYTARADPARQGVSVYRVLVEFAFALNQDEANGIGLRIAAETFPSSEGWQPPAIAVRWIVAAEAEEIAEAVNANLSGAAG